MANTPGVVQHEAKYNPDDGGFYDPTTHYRGNVTGVVRYADAANLTGAITETRTFDITGNVVTASTSCCEQMSLADTTGLLSNQKVQRGVTTLADLSYDYLRPNTSTGRTGQLTNILNNLTHSRDRGYVYDALGRLITATGGQPASWTQQYVYDRYGNRTSVTATGTTGGTSLNPPTNLTATSAANSITLNWTASQGAHHYQIERRTAGNPAFQAIGTSTSPSYTDSPVTTGTAYVYRVRAADAQNNVSASSNARLGVAIAFTDPTLLSGITLVKAAHVTELRQAVNGVRVLAGLPQASWTDATLLALQIRAIHVEELRTALTPALQALSLTVPGFTDAQLFGVIIKKLHIEELRASVNTSGAGDSGGGSSPIPVDGLASASYDSATNRINSAGWEYDAAGNQTRVQRSDGAWQRYVYDAAGRLVKVQNDSGVTQIIHTYGASNHRLIEQVGNESSNQRTYYAWAGDSVIAEYEETAAAPTTPRWVKSYVYLGGRLLATIAPNGGSERVEYHHPDRLGTRLVTNNQDTTSFEQVTLPFGRALDAESSGSTKRRFTSYDRSTVSGLDYAVNRHYDALQGRFTQVDPIGMRSTSLGNPQTLNLYAYCSNDPINHTDPSGLGFFSWLGNVFKKIVRAIFKAVAVAVLTFITSGGNFKRAIVAGVRAFIDEFRTNTGFQPSGGWGRTPPTFGSGPTLRQILWQTDLGKKLAPDNRWFLTPGIAGNGFSAVGMGSGGTLGCGNWEDEWRDVNEIAKKIQASAFAWVKPPSGPTLIKGVTKSHNEIVGMFDTLKLGDPHWSHWGGADRKVLWNQRWYHLTVAYGTRTEKQWRKFGPERELLDVDVRDNTQTPSWITIHCEPDEPGTWTHLFRFIGEGTSRMIPRPWTIP